MLPKKFATNVALKMVVCTAAERALGVVAATIELELRELQVEVDMFPKCLPTM